MHARVFVRRARRVALLTLLILSVPSCGACTDLAAPLPEDPGERVLTALSITPNPAVLQLGREVQLEVLGLDQDGAPFAIEGVVFFESADDTTATVDDDGTVRGVAEGTTLVTAHVGLVEESVPVQVEPAAPPTGLLYTTPVSAIAGAALEPLLPTSTGGFITAYGVTPPLPRGLTLDGTTGAVTGTPTVPQLLTSYTITGENDAGSTTTELELEVRCDPDVAPSRDDDLPDAEGVDANGDGLDGMACGPVFVSPDGSDDNDGSRGAPLLSLAVAIARAESLDPPRDVYLANGSYAGPFALTRALSLVGGFNAAFTTRTSAARARLEGGGTALTIAPASPGDVLLSFLEIVADDGVSAGASSVGVRVQSAGVLTLDGVIVRAGDGANGADGADGTDGIDGVDGGGGGDSCERGLAVACDQCQQPEAGDGPYSPLLGGNAGDGGLPGLGEEDGQPGSPGEAGAAGGAAGRFDFDRDGGDGTPGTPGAPGQDGAGGPAEGDGGDGTPGGDGTGGGGGGGGAGSDSGCNDYGGAGGGGGSAGSGGAAGGGGTKGGSSYGLLVLATDVVLRNAELIAGDGGDGGAGGRGGAAGDGGLGQLGGSGNDGAGFGGFGGDGGDGGRGGHGGGGGGGSSAAVRIDDAGRLTEDGAVLTPGAPGLGGPSFGAAGTDGQLDAVRAP